MKDLYAVGKIAKAFGIKGDLVVHPFGDSTSRFGKLRRVFIGQDDESARETTVTHVQAGRRGVRLNLKGVTDRTAAEKLAGLLVFVQKKDLVKLPKGTFFVHDVVGLNVVDDGETPIGVVKEVLKFPASDVYVIESKGREVMVPAVREFIRKIDLDAGTMTVTLIEGMVEE